MLCRKLKDPMNNFFFIMRNARERQQLKNSKKVTWLLHEHVHPILAVSHSVPPAGQYCVCMCRRFNIWSCPLFTCFRTKPIC